MQTTFSDLLDHLISILRGVPRGVRSAWKDELHETKVLL